MDDGSTEHSQPVPNELQETELDKPLSVAMFMGDFLQTPEVRTDIQARFDKAYAMDPTMTWDEALEAFSRTDNAETLLFHFYRSLRVGFSDRKVKFSDEGLSSEFQNLRSDYYKTALKFNKKQSLNLWSTDELESEEKVRTMKHTAAAHQLVEEGVLPSDKLARTVVHFMAVADGIDDQVDPDRTEKRREAIKKGST